MENTEGLIDFVKFLSDFGWSIFSANRTEELLKLAKIPVEREQALVENNFFLTDTSALIKRILSSTFYTEPADKSNANGSIGLICMNVLPTVHSINSEKKLKSVTKPFNFYVSTILRNAFINYENILILCDPADYKEAMIQLRTNSIDPYFRIYLAAKALNLVSAFDGGIASSILMSSKGGKEFMNYLTYPFEKQFSLRSGSNQQQKGCLYKFPEGSGSLASLQKQRGRELPYNTLSDISFAWEQISMVSKNLKNQFSVKSTNCDGYNFVTQFTPLTGTVFTIAVKNKSILGASLSTNILDSFKKTYTYDTKSISHAILASSSVIDEAAAEEIVKCNFSALVAPGFTQEAKNILDKEKSINLVQIAKIETVDYDMELINGGLLFQTKDNTLFEHWDVKTKNRPGQPLVDQLAFGTILSMGSRSYSAVLLKNNSVVGISQSCKTPERAVDVALAEALIHKEQNPAYYEDGTIADVLVCDSAIPLCDSIRKLTDEGLKAIIHAGGMPQDDQFIEYCIIFIPSNSW